MALLTPVILNVDQVLSSNRWSLHQDIFLDPAPEFIDSINQFGLLRPLIVKKKSNGYDLVCGTKRHAALRQLNKQGEIPCLAVDEQIQDLELLRIVAEDQRASGPLSPIETIRLLQLLSQIQPSPDKATLQSIAGNGITTQKTRLLTLLQLEKPILTAIHHGQISEKTGTVLASLSVEERLFLSDLCIRLSLNANKQRRLIELCRIISTVEECTIQEFISRDYPEFCVNTPDNIPQAAQRLLSDLFERSHPGISIAKKEFQEQMVSLNLPRNCTLSPSPAFENDSVNFTAEFESLEDFEKLWEKVAAYF